jgi:hypothetical protein
LKADGSSELSRLWAVAKLLLASDEAAALAILIDSGESAWVSLGGDVVEAIVTRLRERLFTSILASYDAITLSSASTMLHLTPEDCKSGMCDDGVHQSNSIQCIKLCRHRVIVFILFSGLIARGCNYDSEQDIVLIGNVPTKIVKGLDDGELLRTLTESVAHLERQPLSININKVIEIVQNQIVVEKVEAAAMELS